MELYGRRNSTNVVPVMWCLEELGFVLGGGTSEVRSEGRHAGILALNPNGRIPVLADDGFVLWESNSMLSRRCLRRGDARDTKSARTRPKRSVDGVV
jgi:glutathione S-transferase